MWNSLEVCINRSELLFDKQLITND